MIERLIERTALPGYVGPRIQFSMESIERREENIKSTETLLNEFLTIAGNSSSETNSFWDELTHDLEAQNALKDPNLRRRFQEDRSLRDWLNRISFMADFRNQGAKKIEVLTQNKNVLFSSN